MFNVLKISTSPGVLALTLSASLLCAGSGLAQSPAPPATAPTASAPIVVEPMVSLTSTTTTLNDGSGGTLTTTTETNPPMPDSVENRKLYGGPDSAGGRATAPHPGPVKAASPADAPPKP